MSNYLKSLPDGEVLEDISCPICGAYALADNKGYLCYFCGEIEI